AGVTKLLDSILAGRLPARSHWLFGLDSCITHPDAIERAMKLKGAQVRISHGKSGRSEEHTSELQSRENLVCRLLLEKKNCNMIGLQIHFISGLALVDILLS